MRRFLELDNLFFAVFLATIACIRIFLLAWPISSPVVLDFHFHHYIYGLLLIILALCFDNQYARTAIFGIGFGFFIDETPMFFIHPWNWQVYNDFLVRSALLMLICVIYYFREPLSERVVPETSRVSR